MKLWGSVFGALIGWGAASFEIFGLFIGLFLGLFAGAWLEGLLRDVIQRAVRDAVSPLSDEMHAAIARRASAALGGEPMPPAQAQRADILVAASAPLEPARRIEASAPILPEPLPERETRQLLEPAEPPEPSAAERAVAAVRDWFLGGNTIVRVGLVLLFVGLSFLASYAAAAGYFPLELRLALVAAAGAALLVVGFNRRTVRPEFGLALQGAGVAVLYLTTFASARLFGLVPPLMAFGAMALFCGLGTALALLQNSRAMALIAFAGGFAVPVLLGGESRTPLPLFGYITVLNLAILVIAWRRSWRALNLLGFFATFGMATLWGLSRYDPQHYLVCQVFLAISVLIYLAAALFYAHNTPGRYGNTVDSSLLFGPALVGFGLQEGLMQGSAHGSAWSALAFGTVYAGLAWFVVKQRRAESRLLGECLIAIGLGFVTLAIPLALDAKWTSAVWALEGLGAVWVGSRQARWMVRAFGLALIAVAALTLLTALPPNVAALPLINSGFLGIGLIAAALLVAAWWLRRPLEHSGSRWAKTWGQAETALAKPLFLAGFVFTCFAAIGEVTRKLPPVDAMGVAESVIAIGLQPLVVALVELALMWLFDRLARARDWPVASWPARVSLLILAGTLLVQIGQGRHVLLLPDLLLWLGCLAIHFDLTRRNDAGLAEASERSQGWQKLVHIGGVWLLTAMLADSLQLGIDRAELWDTSWAGVVFLIACIAVLGLLTRWAGRAAPNGGAGLGWPLAQHGRAYWWIAAVPLAVMAYFGALATAALAEGVTDPLPYLPLLNPVDLSVALALAVLALWRRMVAGARPVPNGAEPLLGRPALGAAAVLGFVAVNAIWLRTAHHFLGVGWSGAELGASPLIQTGLAILWTLLAMALMLLAHRRALRGVWITGAALLGLVVAKLLLVDMSSAEGWQRIVTFIGVGVLMLVIGYFVPLPPRREDGPPRREDGPPRREDGPPRREDGPPRRSEAEDTP